MSQNEMGKLRLIALTPDLWSIPDQDDEPPAPDSDWEDVLYGEDDDWPEIDLDRDETEPREPDWDEIDRDIARWNKNAARWNKPDRDVGRICRAARAIRRLFRR